MRVLGTVLLFLAQLTYVVCLWLLACPNCGAQEREIQKEDCATFASAPVPKYHIRHRYHAGIKPMLFLFVSVDPSDISRDDVIALACHIGKKYSAEQALGLWILDDSHAAKVYAPAHEGNSGKTERALRATYEFYRDFFREKDSQFLDWRPDPNDRSRWIHIDLGKAPVASKR